MKYFTIISSLLLISIGKSFLFAKINSKRTQKLFSEAPSNYEDDFKYQVYINIDDDFKIKNNLKND